MRRTWTWEVYGSGYGFLGWVEASSEKAARTAARQAWPMFTSYAVTRVG